MHTSHYHRTHYASFYRLVFFVSIFVKLGFSYFELKFITHKNKKNHTVFSFSLSLRSSLYLIKCSRLVTLIFLSFYVCASSASLSTLLSVISCVCNCNTVSLSLSPPSTRDPLFANLQRCSSFSLSLSLSFAINTPTNATTVVVCICFFPTNFINKIV